MREILGDIDGILVGQSTLAKRELVVHGDRHVAFDEGGSGVSPSHAGADVEGLIAPQRWVDVFAFGVLQPFAILAVADRALFFINQLAMLDILIRGEINYGGSTR